MSFTLRIDGTTVIVPEGISIFQAAQEVGADIPTLCHMNGIEPYTSCMICLVENRQTGELLPSCSTPAEEGQDLSTTGSKVQEARKAAIELLLSEHVGDCEAPCRRACPAFMHIPHMIRQLVDRKIDKALHTVREHIPFPSIIGRICPAPCEKVCRRGDIDRPVAICLLKRYTGDQGRSADSGPAIRRAAPSESNKEKQVINPNPVSGRSVALVGSGPAGLSAAYYLLEAGFICTIYDDHEHPGGMLRYGVEQERLPRQVLESELESIGNMGAAFQMNTRLGSDVSLTELTETHDAVVLALGADTADANIGNITSGKIFSAGDMLRRRQSKLAVRAVAEGARTARKVSSFLTGTPLRADKRFDSKIGKLEKSELSLLMSLGGTAARNQKYEDEKEGKRYEPGATAGFQMEEATEEAERCLQCDCIRQESCKLRSIATEYKADRLRFKGLSRARFDRLFHESGLSFESGKCIKCGLCVRIADKAQERIGLTFSGRSYETKIKIPFGEPLHLALEKTAKECVQACPTAALAWDKKRRSN